MGFVRAAKLGAVPSGTICAVEVNGKDVALANVGGKYCAISGICLHEGGPLGEGALSGTTVICPWHAWEYDVTTGKVVGNSSIGVEAYPVEVRGDEIFVDVG